MASGLSRPAASAMVFASPYRSGSAIAALNSAAAASIAASFSAVVAPRGSRSPVASR